MTLLIHFDLLFQLKICNFSLFCRKKIGKVKNPSPNVAETGITFKITEERLVTVFHNLLMLLKKYKVL